MAGSINLGARRGDTKTDCLVLKNSRYHLDLTLDCEALFALCRDFYLPRYRRERKIFYEQFQFAETLRALEQIDEIVENLQPNQTIVRVGHYSHIECMTITDNAPQTPRRKGTVMPYGTTRTLSDGVYPFGWVRISMCSEQEYKDRCTTKKELDAAFLGVRKKRRRAVYEQKEKTEKQLRLQQQQEEEKQRRDQEEQTRLASMSEDERLLYDFQKGSLNENQVVDVYNRLDSFEPEYMARVADEIREFWQTHGKWSGKQSKKQNEKIQKIKGVLGSA
jgi:hypothetical protein